MKEAASEQLETPSRTLAQKAQEGLTEEELQRFPTQRALQQAVAKKRRVEVGPGADKAPNEMEIVR